MVAVATSRRRAIAVPIYPKQHLFRSSAAAVRGFVGGRGTGKTRIGALDVCLRARDGEPWMSVSPSYVIVNDTTWPTFKEVAEQLGVWVRGVKSPVPRAFFRTQDGGQAEIVFRSGDKPDSLRGPSKAGLWFDEASVMHHDAFLFALPVLRFRGRAGPCLMTFTPKGRRHWTHDVFYERKQTMGGDGAFTYEPKPATYLVEAHTLENPFAPSNYYELIRGHYTDALAQQELAGKFIDLQGLMFLRQWFTDNYVDAVPREGLRVRYWDRAYTEGDGAHTAGVLMVRTPDDRFFIEHVVRGQWSPQDRRNIMRETARRDAKLYDNEVLIYIEQEGAAGSEVGAIDIKALAGYPVFRDTVSRGHRFKIVDKLQVPGEAKIVRAMPFAAQCQAGNVFIVRGPWNDEYMEELCAFPEYAFSDQVDGTSGAFNKVSIRGAMDPGEVTRTDVIDDGARFGVQLIRHRGQRRRQ